MVKIQILFHLKNKKNRKANNQINQTHKMMTIQIVTHYNKLVNN